MTQDIHVALGSRSYDIRVGRGLLAALPAEAAALLSGRRLLIVSDKNVDGRYGAACERALRAAGFDAARIAVPAGETSKSGAVLFQLYDAALDHGLDRRSAVLALGGGVVGDLAGFFAATYLRGIPFLQAPTSLLAMVDSSIGGKTGINLPRGKNLAGAFHQPAGVWADLDTLQTLPAREYRSGLAEVVKYGAIADAGLFDALEKSGPALTQPESPELEAVIAGCCKIKAAVVAGDERESGRRAILNFGHTLGHALEHAAGYGTFLHGEAAAIGMVYAARLSERTTKFPAAGTRRLMELLTGLGLPVQAPDVPWAAVRTAMQTDKKNQAGQIRWVLLEELGDAVHGVPVPEAALEEAWHVSRQ